MLIPFPHHKNVLFNTDKSISEIRALLFTLDCVVDLFDYNFLSPVTSGLTVVISKEYSGPICFREKQTIVLDTTITRWSQAAYQFAHELCHYMIPSEVCSNLRWFEESICELASNFFLIKLAEYWKQHNVPFQTVDGDLYYESFVPYVLNNLQKALPFDVHSDSEIKYLESNCYDRAKNKYVAQLLLPIFQKIPSTWLAVPCLCKISPNQSLRDSLVNWKDIAPQCSHEGVEAILQVFLQ